MSTPICKVEIAEWDDARIEAISEAMLRLIDDAGRISVLEHEPEQVAAAQQRMSEICKPRTRGRRRPK